MALDFYDIGDNKRTLRLFSVSENDFQFLNDALLELKKLSGFNIDYYGTTRIYSQQVQVLSTYIQNIASELKDFGNEKIKKDSLMQLNKYLCKVKDGFLIIGD
ncbi:hypothetical protein GWR56_11565 [Mucilaginibacter sp. 14171R-50]|uniref:hypothetical protein n=1 Tax=Mucilaginibacter sp. 14171R-50 TaxID=2703789 RepID=UPI00138DA61B|nr:hypothetical protein [Mucilaginibacter sp. 14171R-50]QHS56143.1 hypothetical protein GWR56_11565 [Mucilaginibacter sp. 14171R-50]